MTRRSPLPGDPRPRTRPRPRRRAALIAGAAAIALLAGAAAAAVVARRAAARADEEARAASAEEYIRAHDDSVRTMLEHALRVEVVAKGHRFHTGLLSMNDSFTVVLHNRSGREIRAVRGRFEVHDTAGTLLERLELVLEPELGPAERDSEIVFRITDRLGWEHPARRAMRETALRNLDFRWTPRQIVWADGTSLELIRPDPAPIGGRLAPRYVLP